MSVDGPELLDRGDFRQTVDGLVVGNRDVLGDRRPEPKAPGVAQQIFRRLVALLAVLDARLVVCGRLGCASAGRVRGELFGRALDRLERISRGLGSLGGAEGRERAGP